MDDYSSEVTFIPVTKFTNYISDIVSKPKMEKTNVYDIHFTISIVSQLLHKCQNFQHNPKDLQFTLIQSLKQLLSALETEANR